MDLKVPRELGMRLIRADEQLVLLQNEAKAYLETVPYRTRVEPDPHHPGRRRLVVQVRPMPEMIPIRLSECIHHWRASLDNFAYGVSRRHSGHTRRSEFPIFLDPMRFSKDGAKKIQGMQPSAQRVIERLQPYNGGGVRDPLWMLHELSNADKHRLLHTVGGTLDSGSYEVVNLDPGVRVTRVRFLRRRVGYGGTVGYVYVEKHGNPSGTFTLTFSITYNLIFESRTNDLGQPLPTNGERVNVSTSLIRDAVWNAFRELRRYVGRSDVSTIHSAPLLYP